MYIQGDFNGSWLIMKRPDWEEPSQEEFDCLREAGWVKCDLETYMNQEISKETVDMEIAKYWVDAYPYNKIMRAPKFNALVEALCKRELAYVYPYRTFRCRECDGTGRGLQGGMRGYAYTQEDFDDDPYLYEDMMNGRYDGECVSCKGAGEHKHPALTGSEFIVGDEEYYLWLKEHKKNCVETVFDYNGEKQIAHDVELSEMLGYNARWQKVMWAFMSSGTGATPEEAQAQAEANFKARCEKYHYREINSTYRVEEQLGCKWNVESWQFKRTLDAWREAGKLTKDEMYNWTHIDYHMENEYEHVQYDTWTQELEDEWLAKSHDRIIGMRFMAYGSNSYYRPQKTSQKGCSHEECIKHNEPQWAVRLFYAMKAQTIRDERQARQDRETFWGESGTPLHERY